MINLSTLTNNSNSQCSSLDFLAQASQASTSSQNSSSLSSSYAFCQNLFKDKLNNLISDKQTLDNTYTDWKHNHFRAITEKKNQLEQKKNALASLKNEIAALTENFKQTETNWQGANQKKIAISQQLQKNIQTIDDMSNEMIDQIPATAISLVTKARNANSFLSAKKATQAQIDDLQKRINSAEDVCHILTQEISFLEKQENPVLQNKAKQLSFEINSLTKGIELFRYAQAQNGSQMQENNPIPATANTITLKVEKQGSTNLRLHQPKLASSGSQ